MLKELTVVVTTCGRPELLRRAIESCVAAGVTAIVVSASRATEKEAGVIAEFSEKASITSSLLAGDLGCNECWLRGVTLASTKYILILHDDDWLLPEFGRSYREKLLPALERGAGFATWRGQMVFDDGKVITECGAVRGKTRLAGTGGLTWRLLDPEVIPPSPVISVFNRETTIRALREAEKYFLDPKMFTRPTMMIGNETLVYLRHCETYDTWFFLDEILTCYGAHDGSESIVETRRDGLARLKAAHLMAKDHFRSVRLASVSPTRKFFHVWSSFPSTDDTARRQELAYGTWAENFVTGEVYPLPVEDGTFRTTKEYLKDTRSLPFIRDLIDWGVKHALPEDVVFLTNSDVCLSPSAMPQMRATFDSGAPNLFAWRHNFHGPLTHPLRECRMGTKDGGVDLVAFRPEFWKAQRHQFPDFVLGCETWDYVYRILIAENNGAALDGAIYHELHAAQWRDTDFRYTNPGQVFNIRQGQNFFRRRGHSPDGVPSLEG